MIPPDFYFHRGAEESEKEEQAGAEMAVTKREFQSEWIAPALQFPAPQPKIAD